MPSGWPLTPLQRAMVYASIVSPTAVQKMGSDFSRAPVGTGPFRFVEHRPDRYIKLVRFDGYASRPEATSTAPTAPTDAPRMAPVAGLVGSPGLTRKSGMA